MRTQEEIINRCKAIADDDVLSFERDILGDFMTIDTYRALGVLKKDLTEKDIAEFVFREPTDENVLADIQKYMPFAIEKAYNHRGISAQRSVDHMSAWLWLLNRPEIMTKFEQAKYENYGVPKLKVICDELKIPFSDKEELQNMAQGKPCVPGCCSGCGRGVF